MFFVHNACYRFRDTSQNMAGLQLNQDVSHSPLKASAISSRDLCLGSPAFNSTSWKRCTCDLENWTRYIPFIRTWTIPRYIEPGNRHSASPKFLTRISVVTRSSFLIHVSRDNAGWVDLIDWRSLNPIELIDIIKMQMN